MFDDRDSLSLGARLKDAELMGARAAIIVGRQFEQNQSIDIRLLHKPLISSVLRNEESEEVITDIAKSLVPLSSFSHTQANPSDYPFMLYQTSQKFRDEKRIKTGVLRSKEFLMMDL